MNKQKKFNQDGSLRGRGIEWTDYTLNVSGGCFHGCRWNMPDGTEAVCYAETTAEGVAGGAYPEGFEHYYWKPAKLKEPGKVKEKSRIFVGSMTDQFGHWVPQVHIESVIQMTHDYDWHTYQFLTKNAVRVGNLVQAGLDIPQNCWIGASLPPDIMWGKPLSDSQKRIMFQRTLKTLAALPGRFVKWLSIEPLSWDAAPTLEPYIQNIGWIVIGAASTGKEYHQPETAWVEQLHALADDHGVPVFHKGNLSYQPHREDFPV